MKRLSTLAFFSLVLLAMNACKSTNRSHLQSAWYTSGDKSYFVYFESNTFIINSCSNPSSLSAAEAAQDIEKAKAGCKDRIMAVTPMALKDALTAEILGPASEDLVGTKKDRIEQLKRNVENFTGSIQSLNDQMAASNFEFLTQSLAAEIAQLEKDRKKALEEWSALDLALKDPAKLKQIDLRSTLELQAQLATTADEQAAIFTGILKEKKIYALDPLRDTTLIKVLNSFTPSCGNGINPGETLTKTIGIETLTYQCLAGGQLKVITTNCALPGYDRIDNYCIFTGKTLTLNSLASTDSGICAVSQGGQLSCWGKVGTFPMTIHSGLNGLTTVPMADRVTASASQVCALNKAGQVLRCWSKVANVPTNSQAFNQITSGSDHFCGISGGNVSCWGDNSYTQSAVPPKLSSIQSISSMENAVCATDSLFHLACWGLFFNNDDLRAAAAPAAITSALSASVGTRHACAISPDETVTCWGSNDAGQTDVPAQLGTVRLLSSGRYETCSVSLTGKLQCWGGSGATPSDYKKAPEVNDVQKIITSRNGSNFCAIYGSSDAATCWGSSKFQVPYDINPPKGLTGLKDIAITSTGYACAILSNNALKCWGNVDSIPDSAPSTFLMK